MVLKRGSTCAPFEAAVRRIYGLVPSLDAEQDPANLGVRREAGTVGSRAGTTNGSVSGNEAIRTAVSQRDPKLPQRLFRNLGDGAPSNAPSASRSRTTGRTRLSRDTAIVNARTFRGSRQRGLPVALRSSISGLCSLVRLRGSFPAKPATPSGRESTASNGSRATRSMYTSAHPSPSARTSAGLDLAMAQTLPWPRRTNERHRPDRRARRLA